MKILMIEGYDKFYQTILNINERMIIDNVSPGGCADLVVITLFLNQVLEENHLSIKLRSLRKRVYYGN